MQRYRDPLRLSDSREVILKAMVLLPWLIISFTFIVSDGVLAQPGLVVTSLPAVLFQINGGVHNVTAGSVIQLYCSVQSTTVSFSWIKNGRPVVIDIPHLRERTCNDSTTASSVLTVDNFQSSDSGAYQCMAADGNSTGQGDSVELRVAINSSLSIVHHPFENELSLEQAYFNHPFEDNRTGIQLGLAVSMNCAAEMTSSNPVVQIQWTKNGNIVTGDSNHSITNVTSLNSSLEIVNFARDDAGVYQCIFNAESELITTRPFRLQTDIIFEGINTIFLERVSPEVIFLHPPEKLVIEIKATGRYRNIQWHKNGVPLLIQPQQFPNYNEILVYSTTTQDDLGLYEVSLRLASFLQLIVPSDLDFSVMSPVDANTTIINGSDIAVREGKSVLISCTSTGAPTPSISWTLDGQSLTFQPTEVVTKEQSTLVRSDPNDPNSPLVPNIVLGTIISNLLVTNIQYPHDGGVYTCTGSNDNSMINISSAMITVQVIVPPEVEVIASSSQVIMGGSTTLFCNVTRTNPGIVGIYVWINENTGATLSEQSDNLLLTFSADNDFGTYSCTVTNSNGEAGRGNVTITQGFLPVVTVIQPLPVVVGTTIELICIIAGTDPPRTITWTFNGTEFYNATGTTELNISREISSADYGIYTCSASNEFGSNRRTIDIVQAVPPTLIPKATDVEVEVSMSLTLSVNITEFNLEITDIVWLNNNSRAVRYTSGVYTITNSSLDVPMGTAVLFVESVTSPVVYGGVYQVIVTNPAGSDTSTFNVSVLTPVTIVSPLIDSNISVSDEQDNITLMCTARGLPAPVITWNYETTLNERITVMPLIPIYIDSLALFTVESTLIIPQNIRYSSGSYSCSATNIITGSVRMDTKVFDVIVKFAATFYEIPMDIAVLVPDAAVLRCQADGQPVPDITWIRELSNGSFVELISEGNVMITEHVSGLNKTSILTIQPTNTQDSGNYRCRVQNELNSVLSENFYITTYAGPSITFPEDNDMFVVKVTSDITVSCTALGQPPPTVQFYYNGSLLEDNDDNTLSISSPVLVGYEVSRNLTLFNASMWTEALTSLQCQATNTITEFNLTLDSNTSYHIIVQVPPSVCPTEGLNAVITNRGEAIMLSFTIKSASPLVMTEDIRWIYSPRFSLTPFDDSNLDITNLSTRILGSGYIFSNNQLNLTINNIVQALQANDSTDAGRYFLVAANPAGVGFSYIDLIISSPPVITAPPNPQVVINNSNAIFMCVSLRVFPQHQISWVFIDSSGRETEIIQTQNSDNSSKYIINRETGTTRFGTLMIMNATFEDRGIYTCNASNDIGYTEASANLTVQVPPTIEHLSSNRSTAIVAGTDSLTLVCLTTGYPIPSISWLKDSAPFNVSVRMRNQLTDEVLVSSGLIGNETIQEFLNQNTDINLMDITQLGELGVASFVRFFNISQEDEGSYRCVASNELKIQFRVVSQPIQVTVDDAPPIPSSTPSVVTMFDPFTRRLTISLPSFDTSNGPISHYQVVVVILPLNITLMGLSDADSLFPPAKMSSYQESLCGMTIGSVKAYVTAEFSADLFPGSGKFIVGLNSSGDVNSPNDRPDVYVNGRLCYSTKYSFFVRAFPGSIASSSRQYITFTASAYSSEITTNSIVTTESFLQLRIFPVDNCVSWTERNNDQKQTDVSTHITNAINSACSCGFSANNITESVFSCRSSETQVVFKAHISYTSPVGTYTANDLVMLLSSWINSGPSLTVTGTVLSVDPTCPVELESLIDEDCTRPNPPTLSDTLNVTAIWAGALGGVVVIATMIVIVIIALTSIRCSRRTKRLNISSSYELQSVEKSAVDASPEYEVIPAFSEADNPTVVSNIAYEAIRLPEASNPTVESNIAYGAIQLQQQLHELRRAGAKMPAMQESIGDDSVAHSPQDSGSVERLEPSTQAYGVNDEEEPAYTSMM